MIYYFDTIICTIILRASIRSCLIEFIPIGPYSNEPGSVSLLEAFAEMLSTTPS